jgi:peroxiredoxin
VEKLYEEFGGRVEFLGVNLGTEADIKDYMKKRGLTFPVCYDKGNTIASLFDAKIETHILIDKSGVITYKERGFSEGIVPFLKRLRE